MIKRVAVKNLNERFSFDLNFHKDINIITGRNGSGKTTLLKLAWYLISGNIELALSEMTFDKVMVETDKFTIKLTRLESGLIRLTSNLLADYIDLPSARSDLRPQRYGMINRQLDAADENFIQQVVRQGSTVFFPTFRRIEGGFSIGGRIAPNYDSRLLRERAGGIQSAMADLAEHLGSQQHQFVASISTNDISQLLTLKYAEVSEKTNTLHARLARFILEKVPTQGARRRSADDAGRLLEEIEQIATEVTNESDGLRKPLTVLSEVVAKVFQGKGIKVNAAISFGDTKAAIGSETLSAGEKQMLSFLCYNAFAQRGCIFIDEPEISLHVDWQRVLFPVLLEQSTENQFIVATHSPFIYSKYSDKELVLSEDRGGQ